MTVGNIEQAISESIAQAKNDSEVSQVQGANAESQNAQEEHPEAEADVKSETGDISEGDSFLSPEERALEAKATEEEKSALKRWEAAYTKKRQQEAAEIKQLRQQLEEAQKHVTNSPRTEAAQTQKNIAQMTPDEFAKHIQSETIRQFQEAQEAQKLADSHSYQNKMIEYFQSGELDGRLNVNGPEVDPYLTSAVHYATNSALDSYINEHGTAVGFNYQQVMKDAVAAYDRHMDDLFNKKQAQSVKGEAARVARLAKSNPVGSVGKTGNKDMSLDEAIRAAMYGEN